MAQFRVPSTTSRRPVAYENFMGLDTSRPDTTQDTGGNQVLSALSGGYCDEFGQIVRSPGYHRVTKASGDNINDKIAHVIAFAPGEVAWAYQVASGIGFDSTRDHRVDPVWPANAQLSSTVFNGTTLIVARALAPYTYDGYVWREAEASSYLSNYNPALCTTVGNRCIIAGIPLKSTELHFSATNQLRFYNETIDANDTAVTRPGFIDIQNLITKNESITGIAPFEQNRLAVFTQDRMLLYVTHADIEQWEIDNTANVNVGCISHATIQPAGTDLLFCSRTGIHSVRRSRDNGILVYSTSLSERIKRLYRTLVDSVDDPTLISAVFDQDEGKYHVFFPQSGTPFTKRLTLSFNPDADRAAPKWSLTQFLNETCGDYLAGQTVFGTINGIFTAAKEEDETADEYPPLRFTTPLLWHGDIVNRKMTESILIQATGHGTMNIKATNEDGVCIWSDSIQVSYNADDALIPDIPLSAQYDRPFATEYRGVRFEVEVVGGKGLFIVSGFAIYIKGR